MEGADLKDLTYTSFGLIIAYLIPGGAVLLGLYLLSADVETLIKNIVNEKQQAVLFLVLVLAGFGAGVILNAIRFCVISVLELYGRKHKKWTLVRRRDKSADWVLENEDYKELGKKTKVADILAVVEQEFRYHQFYGAMTMVFILFMGAWLLQGRGNFYLVPLPGLILAIFSFFAARGYYLFYVGIAKEMLRTPEKAGHCVIQRFHAKLKVHVDAGNLNAQWRDRMKIANNPSVAAFEVNQDILTATVHSGEQPAWDENSFSRTVQSLVDPSNHVSDCKLL